MDGQNKNVVPILIILTVVLLAGGIYLIKNKKISFPGSKSNSVVHTLRDSALGGFVEAFPQELVIVKDAEIESSYNTYIDVQKVSVISATYTTEARLPDLFAGYLNYFTDEGYKIVLSDSKIAQSRIIAKEGTTSVGVTMTAIDQQKFRVAIDVTVPGKK